MDRRGANALRLGVLAVAAVLAIACSGAPASPTPIASTPTPSPSEALESAGPVEPTTTPFPSAGPATIVRHAVMEGSGIGEVTWKAGLYVLAGNESMMWPVHPTIWTSHDGEAWSVAWQMDCNGGFTGATATTSRFVAVGMCDTDDGRTRFVAASSTDGLAWEEAVVRDPALSTQLEGDGAVGNVVAGPGGLVAVASGLGRGVTFFSADGRTWGSKAVHPGWPTWEITSSANRYLLLAHPGDPPVLARLSEVGSGNWVDAAVPEGLFGVAGLPSGFVGLGGLGSPSGDRHTWRSDDGLAWTAIGVTPTGLYRIVPAVQTLVGLGAGDSEDTSLRTWLWTGNAWAPFADLTIDQQGLHPWSAVIGSGQLVVVAEHDVPNPIPNSVVPGEIVVWVVPLP